jgi:predicted DNA-binding mobile mystery protein A
MKTEAREQMQQRLEESLPGFRLGRAAAGERPSWLRALRQAAGITAPEFAKRMGVSKREIFRLEKSEEESRIMLGSLRRAAEALGCELIYALMPRRGSLGDLAAAERAERAKARKLIRIEADNKREYAGKPRRWPDPQMEALKELIRLAGL